MFLQDKSGNFWGKAESISTFGIHRKLICKAVDLQSSSNTIFLEGPCLVNTLISSDKISTATLIAKLDFQFCLNICRKISREFKLLLIKTNPFPDSLLNSDHLTAIVKTLVHNKTLHATLHIGYTNKETMQYESVTFEKDTIPKDLYKHIVASMSIPLILPAVEIDGKKYMDGGVFHSIPIEAINHLVSSYTNKETPLELMILASKPFNYALHNKQPHHTLFKTAYDAYEYMQGYECISIHNDKQLLDEILKNAGLSDKHVNYHMYCVTQQDAEKWNKAIPMDSYGHIESERIDELVNLGKQSVKDIQLKNLLKF